MADDNPTVKKKKKTKTVVKKVGIASGKASNNVPKIIRTPQKH